jgi:hypothetical protein
MLAILTKRCQEVDAAAVAAERHTPASAISNPGVAHCEAAPEKTGRGAYLWVKHQEYACGYDMTGTIERVQRRSRRAGGDQETWAPGVSMSLVGRRHEIEPNQLVC